MELKAAEVRRELAEKLPRLGQATRPAAEPGKKTTAVHDEPPPQAIATKSRKYPNYTTHESQHLRNP